MRKNWSEEKNMSEPTRRMIESNGIRLNIAEQGKGPLVLFCHGFPESWYSWRHQIEALAAAGFHAVAPDMRGYGKSDAPEAIDQYTIFHLIGDLVGLLDALEAPTASAPSSPSAYRSGHAARCARPVSCRRPRTLNSISCISRNPA
jgi:alpha-beta hydrolase superfamily lysophospholipase